MEALNKLNKNQPTRSLKKQTELLSALLINNSIIPDEKLLFEDPHININTHRDAQNFALELKVALGSLDES